MQCNTGDNGIVVIDSLHIDVESNPYLIMQTLRDKYDSKTPFAAINIWKKLLTIKWNRTKEKGSKHLQSVRDLFTQLDRPVADDRPKNGERFSETMKSIILLNTLPPSLNTDVKILPMHDKITTSQVEALIRKYADTESSQTNPMLTKRMRFLTLDIRRRRSSGRIRTSRARTRTLASRIRTINLVLSLLLRLSMMTIL